MPKHHRIAMLIPYFGKIPDYFDLWLRTAEYNHNWDFFLYTDLAFPVESGSNVKVKYMTFAQLQSRIRERLGSDCVIGDPYKLCDYKPAYGVLFQEDLVGYDFWGFCDIDVLLGDLDDYVTDELLACNDKLFDLGHFCLMRNSPKMNELYRQEYPCVLPCSYAFRTNYICHFDENGTIAYAPEYDSSLRLYTEYSFFDVPFNSYPMLYDHTEVYVRWQNGKLELCLPCGQAVRSVMYVHLQKRTMHRTGPVDSSTIIAYRDFFLKEPPTQSQFASDDDSVSKFLSTQKKRRYREILTNLRRGALPFRLAAKKNRWRNR